MQHVPRGQALGAPGCHVGEGDEEMGCRARAVDCEGGEAAAADSRAAGSGGEHNETSIMVLFSST